MLFVRGGTLGPLILRAQFKEHSLAAQEREDLSSCLQKNRLELN